MNMMEGLYQDIILDHYKHPRNYVELTHIHEDQVHENPTCGDNLKLELVLDQGMIKEVRQEAHGCAISVSSTSMMSEFLTGKTVEEARLDIQDFLRTFREQGEIPGKYEDLIALEGVMQYPLRIKCATLAWHAAEGMLKEV